MESAALEISMEDLEAKVSLALKEAIREEVTLV